VLLVLLALLCAAGAAGAAACCLALLVLVLPLVVLLFGAASAACWWCFWHCNPCCHLASQRFCAIVMPLPVPALQIFSALPYLQVHHRLLRPPLPPKVRQRGARRALCLVRVLPPRTASCTAPLMCPFAPLCLHVGWFTSWRALQHSASSPSGSSNTHACSICDARPPPANLSALCSKLHTCGKCGGGADQASKDAELVPCRRCPLAYHRRCLLDNLPLERSKEPGKRPRVWLADYDEKQGERATVRELLPALCCCCLPSACCLLADDCQLGLIGMVGCSPKHPHPLSPVTSSLPVPDACLLPFFV
jgi:hypothetical protein